VSIITQNIDGLHQRAGATDVVELHVGTQRSAPVASSGAVFPSRASRERKWNDSC
jgi:NAD-dependent SIR2 family protein deacetylase